jgi:hypothetical protein
MKKRSNINSFLLIGTCLFTLLSCGNSDDDSSKNSVIEQEEEQREQDDEGIFRAVLRPLNVSVAGNTTGTVEIKIKGDDVVVESNVAGAPAGVKHHQNIMTLTSCPTETSDANNDSVVDIAEALPSVGFILIPLDSDLSAQLDGMSYGPIANSSGSYFYRRSTTLSALLSDLGATDPDSSDAVKKLSPGENLNLAGRVVVVHGVRSSDALPETTATLGENKSSEVLPIACGELVRVTDETVSSNSTN